MEIMILWVLLRNFNFFLSIRNDRILSRGVIFILVNYKIIFVVFLVYEKGER